MGNSFGAKALVVLVYNGPCFFDMDSLSYRGIYIIILSVHFSLEAQVTTAENAGEEAGTGPGWARGGRGQTRGGRGTLVPARPGPPGTPLVTAATPTAPGRIRVTPQPRNRQSHR